MAIVRWNGETFSATPIERRPDGSWLMRSLQHTGRLTPGTNFVAKPTEIMGGMPAPGQPDTTPAPPDNGQAALDAAMAEERETLPRPAELMAQFQASKRGAGAVPPGPTQAPTVAPNQPRGQ